MKFFSWMRPNVSSADVHQDIFGDGQSRVVGSFDSSGFGELYLPDRLRSLSAKAVCQCLVAQRKVSDPYLLVRAVPSCADPAPVLSIELGGVQLGSQQIFRYGTYYFPIPEGTIKHKDGWQDVVLTVQSPPLPDSNNASASLALYELRRIDVERDEFPDKQSFANKLSLFSPAGGYFYSALMTQTFKPENKLLEIGAGEGHLACMISAFSGASVTGIDVINYRDVKQRLSEEFRLHRAQLRNTAGLESMAGQEGLADVMQRANLVTMSAEETQFENESFDFVYSLNVMEHIPHPERAFTEIFRVLRPGGIALLQYSPLYYSDSGSHLPPTLGFNQPWAQLLMTREQIKYAILEQGGIPNEVDNILDSLNGCVPQVYYDAVAQSGLKVLGHEAIRGFTLPNSEQLPEFAALREKYSEVDLTTVGMYWLLQKS